MQSLRDLSESKMLVNSTPIGMKGKAPGISPIDEDILKTLPEGALLFMTLYTIL